MMRSLIITIAALITVCLLQAGNASAHPAWGIVADRQGRIYFSDLETVWKIDAQGKLTVFRQGVSGRHIHELALDESGNLYGADYTYEPETKRFNNALWKMTPAGVFAYLPAPPDGSPKGLSLWRDRDGNMYSVEQDNHLKRETLLLRRTTGGLVTTLAGGSYGYADGKGSQARFRSIVGMAFGPDGSLYLADDTSVRKVTMDGTVTTMAGELDKKDPDKSSDAGVITWGSLMGLAVNSQGDVYVADYRNRRVLKIASGGVVSTVARAEPPWSPTGIATYGGELYILEIGFTPPSTYRARVRKVSPDGSIKALATAGENVSQSAVETTPGEGSERNVVSRRSLPYLLLGASLFALIVFIWLRRR